MKNRVIFYRDGPSAYECSYGFDLTLKRGSSVIIKSKDQGFIERLCVSAGKDTILRFKP